jgi:hypothetical protein
MRNRPEQTDLSPGDLIKAVTHDGETLFPDLSPGIVISTEGVSWSGAGMSDETVPGAIEVLFPGEKVQIVYSDEVVHWEETEEVR